MRGRAFSVSALRDIHDTLTGQPISFLSFVQAGTCRSSIMGFFCVCIAVISSLLSRYVKADKLLRLCPFTARRRNRWQMDVAIPLWPKTAWFLAGNIWSYVYHLCDHLSKIMQRRPRSRDLPTYFWKLRFKWIFCENQCGILHLKTTKQCCSRFQAWLFKK